MACPEPRKHVAIRARHPRSLLGGCVEATGASETRTHAASHSGARWSLCPAHVSPAHICVRLSIVCAPSVLVTRARTWSVGSCNACWNSFILQLASFRNSRVNSAHRQAVDGSARRERAMSNKLLVLERLVRKLGPKRGLGQS